MSDDHGERIARLEASQEGARIAIKAEIRGYLDGALQSIQHDAATNHDELERQIVTLRTALHGDSGDNGFRAEARSDIRIQKWHTRILWIVVVALIGAVTGIRLPIP